MRILVTGGCGFIGSAVIRSALASVGNIVCNIDKLSYAAMPESLESIEAHPGYQFVQADICESSKINDVLDWFAPDAVMHLAAESHVDRSIDGPGAFIETNVLGTYVMLEAARRYWSKLSGPKRSAFRFHHVSTDEVYGSLDWTEPSFTEATPYRPRSPYSASKAGADHLVRAWGETYGLPVVITNCSNNYGPWQFPEKLIPVMILNAREKKPLPIYGAGRNVRDWLHVEDHARALLLVLQSGQEGETYNIGGNAERANIEVVHAICGLMDTHFPANAPHADLIEYVDDRPGHDLRYAIDASKIRSDLGWEPSYSLEEGLAETVKWYLANEEWWRGIRQRKYDGGRLGLVAGTVGASA